MRDPNDPASSSPENVQDWSILIVDDEPMIRRVAELSLNGAGCRMAEAADAAGALAAVRAADPPFDLIILDITLPDGDGTAIVPLIRQSAPHTRILVVSGLGEVHDAGADGFLAKPFTKSSLLSAVRRLLE
jgi:two-component system KDP operon response regulator KdpE